MFPLEQGAFEMLLIGAIALIVVGPKDLPVLMRKVGQFTAKMRGMAAEFRASFDEMARQSELDELRKEVEALRTGQYAAPVLAEIDTPLSNPSIPEVEPLLSPRATGGGDQALLGLDPRNGEGGAPPPPRSAVPLSRDTGEEKAPRKPRKPRVAKPVDPEISETGA